MAMLNNTIETCAGRALKAGTLGDSFPLLDITLSCDGTATGKLKFTTL
jgi:hypothetical protein